ncbi:Glycine rich protein [Balamuthia mandrillaris]
MTNNNCCYHHFLLLWLLSATTLLCCFAGVNGELTAEFNSPGEHIWEVPPYVEEITVYAEGAGGGTGHNSGGPGGEGGWVRATLMVTPGETLYLNVGGRGTNGVGYGSPSGGINGGGNGGYGTGVQNPGGSGGGASDVRRGNNTLEARLLVAGGGGGGASQNSVSGGGKGGTTTGENGQSNNGGLTWGGGGTQEGGGAAGSGSATGGSTGQGGSGGRQTSYGGGGGGGGYFGGGGGGVDNSVRTGGGGGGSSFVIPEAVNVSHGQGGQPGNGVITLSFMVSPPTLLTSSQNPSTYGQSLNFYVQVPGLNATGNVTFFINNVLGEVIELNEAGEASLTTSTLPLGTHTIQASYGGDSNNLPSSTSLEQVVVSSDDGSGSDGSNDGGSNDGDDGYNDDTGGAGIVRADDWWKALAKPVL